MTSPRTRWIASVVLVSSFAPTLGAQAGGSLLQVPEETAAEKARRSTAVTRTMERVGPAVVHVMVKVNGTFRLQRSSSGVVIRPDGLVLTNWHLVRETKGPAQGGARFSIVVKNAAGKEMPADLVARHEPADLALLRIKLAAGETIPSAELGGEVMPGEVVVAATRDGGSRPGDFPYANFIGSLSPSLAPVRVNGHTIPKKDIVLADANTKITADGSPVFDINGRVLAIVNNSNVKPALHEKSSDEERRAYRTSFGFAVRASVARRVFAEHLGPAARLSETEADRARRGKGLAGAAALARASVVSVRAATYEKMPATDPSDPNGKFPDDQLGSGVLVHPSGLVLTNAHLVGSGAVRVTTLAGETFPGTVLGRSTEKNVALVRLELPEGRSLPALKVANSADCVLGERIAALGNRYGHTVTVKTGVLSSGPRSKDVGDQHKRSMAHFQTDATIHNGNTGGAIINIHGELLAIADVQASIDEMNMKERHQALMALTDSTIGFGLPVNTARKLLADALSKAGEAGAEVAAIPPVQAEARAARTTAAAKVVEAHALCFLNVFVKKVSTDAPEGGLMADLFPEPADDSDFRLLGQGSGVIIDPTGLALTNWHVVDAATYKDGAPRKDHKVFVSLRNGKKYEVEVLSTSRIDDLALLQMKLAPGEVMQAIQLGDSDAIQVGDTAIAVGNPHGFANSVTVGVVSAKNRDIRIKGRARYFRGLIQTDAAINPGNSGGALVDLNGRLIGINSAGHQKEARQGFAIPVNYVRKKFHTTLLSSDKLRSIFLGMETGTDARGVVVKAVSAFGPAKDAGVQVGDVIVAAQSRPVKDSIQFVKVTRAAAPFQPFAVRIQRGGETKELSLQPVSDASWSIFRRAGFAVKEVGWGVAGEELKAAAVAAYRAYTGDPKGQPTQFTETGLIVTHVHPDAVSAGMDMRPGDVVVGIRARVRDVHLGDRYVLENIHTLKDMRSLIRKTATKEGSKLELWTVRDGKVIRCQVTAKKVKT